MTKSFFRVIEVSGNKLSYVIYGMAALLFVNWLVNIFLYESAPISHVALFNAGVLAKLGQVVNK